MNCLSRRDVIKGGLAVPAMTWLSGSAIVAVGQSLAAQTAVAQLIALYIDLQERDERFRIAAPFWNQPKRGALVGLFDSPPLDPEGTLFLKRRERIRDKEMGLL